MKLIKKTKSNKIFKLLILSLITFIGLFLTSCGDDSKYWESISFEDKVVNYDGKEHSLEIEGALKKAHKVEYVDNAKTNAGVYEVVAKIVDEATDVVLKELTATLTISKKALSVEALDQTVFYKGVPQTFTIDVSELPVEVEVTYTNNVQTEIGEYEVTITFEDKSGNYEIVDKLTATFKIVEEDYEVSLVDKSVVYDGSEHKLELTGTLREGLAVEYVDNAKTNAGVYEVIAKIVDEATDVVLKELTATLTISKKALSVEALDQTVFYKGVPQTYTIDVSELPSEIEVTYTNNVQTEIGEYEVTITFEDKSGNYEIVDELTATFKIVEEDYEVSLVDKNVVYDGSEHKLELTGTLREGLVVEYVDNAKTNAGVYEVVAKIVDEATDVVLKELTATLTISKKMLDVEFNNLEVKHDGSSYSISIDGEIPEDVSVFYVGNNKSNVGQHKVVAMLMSENYLPNTIEAYINIYYEVTYVFIEDTDVVKVFNVWLEEYDKEGKYFDVLGYSLTKGSDEHIEYPHYLNGDLTLYAIQDVDIVLNNKEIIYDGTEHKLELTGTLREGLIVEYVNHVHINAGVYEVVAKIADEENRQVLLELTATLTISKKVLDLEFNNLDVKHDGSFYSILIEGEIPEDVSVFYVGNNKSNVGEHKVVAMLMSENYLPNTIEAYINIYYEVTYMFVDEIETHKVYNTWLDYYPKEHIHYEYIGYSETESSDVLIDYPYYLNGHTALYAVQNLGLRTKELNFDNRPEFDDSIITNIVDGVSFQYSKAAPTSVGHVVLEKIGILTNITPLNGLKKIKVTFTTESAESKLLLYYGKYALPIYNETELVSDIVFELQEEANYLVIESLVDLIEIESIVIYQEGSNEYIEYILPTINITTALDESGNHLPILNKSDYVDSKIIIEDVENPEFSFGLDGGLDAGIRLRGNSTRVKPKKPYKIKFDKKQSLFGLPRAKAWALLADYMDGSGLHNYIALTMGRHLDGMTFSPSSIHINLYLNGEYQGVYLLTEHMDVKEGRTEIEMNITPEIQNEDINFMIELDNSAPGDPTDTLDETYFRYDINDREQYFSIKYPKLKEFPSEEQYYDFFEYIKSYVHELWTLFNGNDFEELANNVDIDSLVDFFLVDFITQEADHMWKSVKMHYNANDEKLYFGPIWDYDALVLGLPYTSEPIEYPFDEGAIYRYVTESISCPFFRLFKSNYNGMEYVKARYNDLDFSLVDVVLNKVDTEIMPYVTKDLIIDANIWYEGNMSMVFENIKYNYEFLRLREEFLNNYFA